MAEKGLTASSVSVSVGETSKLAPGREVSLLAKERRGIIRKGLIYLVLIIGSVIFLLPLFWMISTSLKTLQQTMVNPPVWIPEPVKFSNFLDVLAGATSAGTTDTVAGSTMPFPRYFVNTVYVCLMGAIGIVLSSSFVAYGFARIKWPGRDIFFVLTLSTMMLPFAVYMIPLYIVYKKIGLTGTFMPLWLPWWFGNAFNIFLLRQFFMRIPNELSEAARIDGCSEVGIYWRIVMPLARPALAVVFLFHFMWMWKEFLQPLIFLNSQDMFTLSLGLQFFQSQHNGTEWQLLMAAATMMTIPIIIIFFFTQKTFIQGIALTGLKG